MKTCRS